LKVRYQAFKIMITGFFMGIAMILPGMSWPTIAIIIGVYEPLMLALGKLTSKPKDMNLDEWNLLLYLMIGIVPSIFLTSAFVLSLMNSFKFELNAFFIGLIVGSAYLLYYEVKKKGLSEFIWFAIGFIIVILPFIFGIRVSDARFFSTRGGMEFLDLISGFAVSTALPAVGDTIMLLLLGNYRHLLLAVKVLDLITLSFFVTGFLIGFFIFTRMISSLLRKYHSRTFAFIIGLMMASISTLWPFEYVNCSSINILIFIILGVIGFLISIYLARGLVKHGFIRGDNYGK
jgi:putative membrane protein